MKSAPPRYHQGVIVDARIQDVPVRFFVKNMTDPIQAAHLSGRYYEEEELRLIAEHLAPGAVFLDVGANVGNHALFVEKHCAPEKVIPIEPGDAAREMLVINLLLNATRKVDARFLGLGLSDAPGSGRLMVNPESLGTSRMSLGGKRGTRLVTGDSLFADQRIDFIKIDVEGFEMRALRGLAETLARCRPTLFVEVDEENAVEFEAWRVGAGYAIVARTKPYPANENFLLKPAG